MVQASKHTDKTITFPGTSPSRGWFLRELSSGWTVSGYMERDGYISSFSAVCEDGAVVKIPDGTVHSTCESIFQEFLEEFQFQ